MSSPDLPPEILRAAVAHLAPTLPLLTDLGERFAGAGHELALVGGPVRDAFLGRGSSDLDLTTSATPEQIEEVCRSVIRTWRASATEAQHQALFAGRPTIPSDVDRALLMDLSARLGVYEIIESDLLTLRHRFWDVAEELVGRTTS